AWLPRTARSTGRRRAPVPGRERNGRVQRSCLMQHSKSVHVGMSVYCTLAERRIDEINRHSDVLSIDSEVGIEREYGAAVVNLRHANHAGVGKRHRHFAVFLEQLSNCRKMLVDLEPYREDLILDERHQLFLCGPETSKQVHCLR